ncbi:MAG: tRNA (adenosine(37)-N6)-dimethylallyltransferase MiaA [Oscillospiraceae bacterium]|nr:tRNA (adenosine(37)-N6)-dimethylallyltransferase MiaA [Oscillospiraceae bacterium]
MPPKIVCVVGPTASGKTKMGVALARRFDGEVVSVDSMQIYRGMTIGTAAPTAEEMEGVPHHMIAVADPAESWSVARFTEAADTCVQDILRRGKLPVLVGGTGLYLDALVRGNSFAEGSAGTEIRAALQKRMETEGAEVLLAELRSIDPEAAARLHLKDEKRILRALEVWQETGKTITQHNLESQLQPPRYEAVYIGLDFQNREDLRARIDRRVDLMVEQGLLQEVQTLLGSGIPRTATALQAIGYKQFLAVEEGYATASEAVEEVKLRSRQYAKRQLTWLRRNQSIHWIRWEKVPDFQKALQKATEILTAEGLS